MKKIIIYLLLFSILFIYSQISFAMDLRVIQTIPDSNMVDIDPSTNEIVIIFSEAVKQNSWSFVEEIDKGEFPEITGEPYFKDNKTCVLPVLLKANTVYSIGINTDNKNFKSADDENISVMPYIFVFTTGKIRPYIAVLDLQAEEGVTESEARILTDQLQVELLETGKFKIMARTELASILEEQEFKSEIGNNLESAVETGQLIGVEQIIIGSIAKFGKSHNIIIKVIDVETGEILEALSDNCNKCKIDDLFEIISSIVHKLAYEEE